MIAISLFNKTVEDYSRSLAESGQVSVISTVSDHADNPYGGKSIVTGGILPFETAVSLYYNYHFDHRQRLRSVVTKTRVQGVDLGTTVKEYDQPFIDKIRDKVDKIILGL